MNNPSFAALIAGLSDEDMRELLENIDPDWADHFPFTMPELAIDYYSDEVTEVLTLPKYNFNPPLKMKEKQ